MKTHDLNNLAREAIHEKHGHTKGIATGIAIKRIRTLKGGRHEVTYTEGIVAVFNCLFAQHEGRRDRTKRQRLVFAVDPQTGRPVLQASE